MSFVSNRCVGSFRCTSSHLHNNFLMLRSIASKVNRNTFKSTSAVQFASQQTIGVSRFTTTTPLLQQRPQVRASNAAYQKNDALGIFAAVAAIGAVAGLGNLWYNASGSKEISREELISIYNELTYVASQILDQLSQKKDQIIAEAKEKGQEINLKALENECRESFVGALGEVESQLFEQVGCTPEQIEAAFTKYGSDPEVQARIMQLQQVVMSSSIMPATEANVEVPESLTKEKVLAIVEDLLTSLTRAMEDLAAELKLEGITNLQESVAVWQPRYTARVQEIMAAHHAKYQLTEELFQAALLKYQEDEDFLKQLEKLQLDQQRAFANLGFTGQA